MDLFFTGITIWIEAIFLGYNKTRLLFEIQN